MPVTNPILVDVREEGASQGRVTAFDFTGTGVTATVSGTTATIAVVAGGGGDIALSLNAPSVDETITAGNSALVQRKYTIASTKKLTIGLAAIFRIH